MSAKTDINYEDVSCLFLSLRQQEMDKLHIPQISLTQSLPPMGKVWFFYWKSKGPFQYMQPVGLSPGSQHQLRCLGIWVLNMICRVQYFMGSWWLEHVAPWSSVTLDHLLGGHTWESSLKQRQRLGSCKYLWCTWHPLGTQGFPCWCFQAWKPRTPIMPHSTADKLLTSLGEK